MDQGATSGIQLGDWIVRSVETGRFALDGGAMFGVVPRPLWSRAIPPDDRGRIELAARVLLLEQVGGPQRVLVDTGLGNKWDPKSKDIYGMDPDGLAVEQAILALGVHPDEITDVLLTHLHFDHVGGAVREFGDDLRPTFPNATYWIQQGNLDWARNPTPKDRASYRPQDFEPLLKSGVVEILDGPCDQWKPGIELVISHGHTRSMQLPIISGSEGGMLYGADLLPTAAHIPVAWVMGYDNEPLKGIAEKQEFLERVVANNWFLAFEHDPFGPGAYVVQGVKGFAAGERIDF